MRDPRAKICSPKTAIAYLQMPCNILQVLPKQLGKKFDRAVKRSKVILGSSFKKKSGRSCIHLMLYTKIKPKSFLGSGEDF